MKKRPANLGADLRIPRRATALIGDRQADIRPLNEWRELDAYVLLGEPGAGKSVSFIAEAKAIGGVYCSARDFVALGVESEDVEKTLFIDGLDEMRAGGTDGRMPVDAIRAICAGLKALGRPRFRLSCREHDWRAQRDLDVLAKVARGGLIKELHLEPLSREEQGHLLQARRDEVPDHQAFLERPFHQAIEAVHRKLHQHGIPH